ncbi:hypothetical protein [Planctomycetes bacterium TBK1r]|uniref:hypothetical protein n=1 Tax=Stieleria magnilauensis TaxID=2527963 RepID=UPI0011A7F8C0|nr:hypothetical protein [Phycisphaera sp. RhM]
MKFFISPPEATSWNLEVQELAHAIQKTFGDIEIHPMEHETSHALEWTSANGIEGSLDSDRNTIVLEGDIGACARFALWYRDFVPNAQALVFFDESYSADVALTANTNIDDLMTPFVPG